MTLQEGIAEFRLSSGVQLSLEGPAAVVMTSSSSLVLQYGKLTAYVPDATTDFKVMAGGGIRLNASRAAFGVDLAGADTEIHVFSGEVKAANTSIIDDLQDLAVDDNHRGRSDETTRSAIIFEA